MELNFVDPESPFHPGVIQTGDSLSSVPPPPPPPPTVVSSWWTSASHTLGSATGEIPRVLMHTRWSDWYVILQISIVLLFAIRVYRACLLRVRCAELVKDRLRALAPVIEFRPRSEAAAAPASAAVASAAASAPPLHDSGSPVRRRRSMTPASSTSDDA